MASRKEISAIFRGINEVRATNKSHKPIQLQHGINAVLSKTTVRTTRCNSATESRTF